MLFRATADSGDVCVYANEWLYFCKFQNTSARIITRSVRSSHITPVLKSLHWLHVNYRIILRLFILLIVRCFYMNLITLVICSALIRFNSHSLRSSSFNYLLFPYFNKK